MSRTLPAVRLCPSLVLGAPGGFLACPAPCPRSGSARPLCWVLQVGGVVGGVAMLVVVMLVRLVVGVGVVGGVAMLVVVMLVRLVVWRCWLW